MICKLRVTFMIKSPLMTRQHRRAILLGTESTIVSHIFNKRRLQRTLQTLLEEAGDFPSHLQTRQVQSLAMCA